MVAFFRCEGTPCRRCGRPVERERRVYVVPVCYSCLPPPPPIPVVPFPGGGR